MQPLAVIPRSGLRSAAAALGVACVCTTPSAQPAPDGSALRLTMLSTQYVVGAARFDDLAGVDAWLRTRDARVVAIDRCEAAATPQLLAAVQRFYPQQGSALEIRALPPGAAACKDAGIASLAFVAILRHEDYTATDERGRSIMP